MERWLLGKVKILRQKCLFKKQSGERKTIHNMWTNGFIETFHFQLVLNGPYWPSAGDCRTTRFVIWQVFLLIILWNLSVRNQSDMQSPMEIIVLPLILTRWKLLSQSLWLVVMWTCQDDQCIGNKMKYNSIIIIITKPIWWNNEKSSPFWQFKSW